MLAGKRLSSPLRLVGSNNVPSQFFRETKPFSATFLFAWKCLPFVRVGVVDEDDLRLRGIEGTGFKLADYSPSLSHLHSFGPKTLYLIILALEDDFLFLLILRIRHHLVVPSDMSLEEAFKPKLSPATFHFAWKWCLVLLLEFVLFRKVSVHTSWTGKEGAAIRLLALKPFFPVMLEEVLVNAVDSSCFKVAAAVIAIVLL